MKKKYQVFISSTIEDLKEERQRAINTLVNSNIIPAGMELFRGSEFKWKAIKEWMEESDIYLLIVGDRYGTIDPETKMSYTEREYEYAEKLNMPMIIITIDDSMTKIKEINNPNLNYHEIEYIDQFNKFKERINVRRHHIVLDLTNLETTILQELPYIIGKANDIRGWVRANNANETILLNTSSKKETDKSFSEFVEFILRKNYKSKGASEYQQTIGEHILNAIRGEELLEYDNRIINIYQVQKNRIRITISTVYKYLQVKKREFGVDFHATKEQAESYILKSFKINGVDYIDRIEIKKEEENRLHFPYHVYGTISTKGIRTPVEISVENSYECSIASFFHSHHLACPCGKISATVYLDDKLKKNYSIISSVSSPYTMNTSDSVKANDIMDRDAYYISLPNWSPRGAGYSMTLIKH